MPQIKSVKDADVAGKRVLVRVDLDVLEGTAVIDMRLRAAVPTLQLLHDRGAVQIVIVGYVGRPGGKVVEALRVAPVAKRLQELAPGINFEVKENLRFDPREEANDKGFAKELATLGDIFVNESFATAHRAYASIVGIPKFLPSFAGLRFEEEMRRLTLALTPPHGALAVIGGVKFETKVPLIKKLLGLYAEVLLGGALANDIIKARGLPFGSSLLSDTPVPEDIASDDRLLIPDDAIFAETGSNAERSGRVVDIRAEESVIDIGPATSKRWAEKISKAPFVLWNGPMGIYEQGYRDGTDVLAAELVRSGIPAVVGGGDTAAAVSKFSFNPEKVFISTGGGAMLQFLADGTLPAIEALKTSKSDLR